MTQDALLGYAFAAGLSSSIGPCVAPRYAVIAAHIARGSSTASIASFALGTVSGYVVFAGAGSMAVLLNINSHAIYAVAALALIAVGVHRLLASSSDLRYCGSHGRMLGGSFLAGLGCSIFGSPCCAPIAFAIGFQSGQVDASFGALTMLAFGAGHILPIAIIGAITRFGFVARKAISSDAGAAISGTILVAVGCLYAAVA